MSKTDTKSLVALVGTKFRGRAAMDMLASLSNGAPLILKRDPDNEFDPRCVEVWAGGVHIGFIKKEQNAGISARMDSAAADRVNVRSLDMPAKLAIDGGKQPMVEID
jgi:hypothetical protein